LIHFLRKGTFDSLLEEGDFTSNTVKGVTARILGVGLRLLSI
jgi:hypothetical protein